MIEADEIQPRGVLAELFRPEPIAAGDLPSPSPPRGPAARPRPRNRVSKNVIDWPMNSIMLARRDPATARELRDLLRFGRRDPRSLAGVDALLNELGIPVPEAVT